MRDGRPAVHQLVLSAGRQTEGRRGDFGRRLSRNRENADQTTTRTVVFKLNTASRCRKQRIVLSETNVFARLEATPALPNEDGSTLNEVAIKPLDAETLGLTVSTVSGAPLTLLMCHDSTASFAYSVSMPVIRTSVSWVR